MEQARNNDLDGRLTPAAQKSIRQGVQRGIQDLEHGRYEELDEDGLRKHFAGIGERGRKRLAAIAKPSK